MPSFGKGTTARKLWLSLDRRCTATLLKLRGIILSTAIGVITGHCIIGTLIGIGHLANDFCRSCGDEEKDETILHLLCTWPALGLRRKRHRGSYYMEGLDELSCMDIVVVQVVAGIGENMKL